MVLVYLVKPRSVESCEEEKKGAFPPLGLLYLSSAFRIYGCSVKFYDLDFTKVNGLVDDVSSENPEIIALTSTTPSYHNTVKVIQRVREASPSSIIVVGGPHATLVPEDFRNVADIVVVGEGENAASEIVESAVGKHLKKPIIKRPPVEDLDKLPFPDRSILNIEQYHENIGAMFTSRGCPYNCLFCTTRFIMGRKFRARSPINIVEEWRMLKKYNAPKIRS